MPHEGTPTFYALKRMKGRMPKTMAAPPLPNPPPLTGEGANVMPTAI
jgi:hypothetical protein